MLKPLRHAWLALVADCKGPQRLLARSLSSKSEPLFSPEEVDKARSLLFPALGIDVGQEIWAVRVHQPMCLNALERLASFVGDSDVSLFHALRTGAPMGFSNDIPESYTFWPNDRDRIDDVPLSLHMQNWRSADVDPSVTQ